MAHWVCPKSNTLRTRREHSNLETFLEVVVLVGVDELRVPATIKDDRVVLVI